MFWTFPVACPRCLLLYIITSFNLQKVWMRSVDNEVDVLIYCFLAGRLCTASAKSSLCLPQMHTMLIT